MIRRSPRGRSLFGDVTATARRISSAHLGRAWPAEKWQKDPVGFTRTILGYEPWAKQREILEAVPEHKRIAVTSGHKTGKSRTAATVGLWFYSSFEGARVIITAPTGRQVDGIVYRETRKLIAESGRCCACRKANPQGPTPCEHSAVIAGEVHELARSGVKSNDFREIIGATAKDKEAVAGTSGENLLYIIDEASGVAQDIFEAIEGNRAAGAWLLMFSNPTRNTGEFAEAFGTKAQFYWTLSISSEETPNAVTGKNVIPGLAGREWIEEKKIEWGEDSPLYWVRVKGKFVPFEKGALFPVAAISAAEERWEDAKPEGRLILSCDPAGSGGLGDESAFVARRGKKVMRLHVRIGLNEDAHLVELLGMMVEFKADGEERPIVIVDRDGPVGAKVYGIVLSYLHQHPDAFDLVGVRSGERAQRKPHIYDRVRDEMWAATADWMRDGGAIPADVKLAKELNSLKWEEQVTGRVKVTPKPDLRKELGRSPDRADALALSCWVPSAWIQAVTAETTGQEGPRGTVDPYEAPPEQTFDPYAAQDPFK